ncbi:hypothetical protein IGI04_015615 [Brassica rapa subsp. trilocularis]|uniref:Uncharacterized protein n=1 Tax=Brassica rapa subsp. trilocularis TaxID=1813537 RepID=A0ABQ7MS26_BRACM|nr:hypothetical protein IGI04_015615 [Brassica rapa subsp. trilocularis]
MNHSVFRARETETWRIVALKKVGFDKFEPESVYIAKDFPEPRVFMDSRNYANQKVQSLEAVYPTFSYAMPMTKKSEFFEDKLKKMKLRQDYRSL